MRIHVLLAILTLVSSAGLAPPRETPSGMVDPVQGAAGLARADSIVSAWVEAERVPGAVLLVSRDGRTVLERAYGWAQLYEYGEGQYGDEPDRAKGDDGSAAPGIRRLAEPWPMTVETVFDLASLTKVVATTLAVMDLVSRGDLDLDAPLHRYLRDFQGDARDQVTLRHLLAHGGGLAQWLPVYYHAADPEAAYAQAEVLHAPLPILLLRATHHER